MQGLPTIAIIEHKDRILGDFNDGAIRITMINDHLNGYLCPGFTSRARRCTLPIVMWTILTLRSQNPSFSRSWESIVPTSLASVFYRAEAGSLGHVMLLWIGPGVWIRFSFGFSRTVESASDT